MPTWMIERELARLRNPREDHASAYLEIPLPEPAPVPAPRDEPAAPQRGVQTFDI